MILQGACSTSKSLFRRAGVLLLPLISPISAAVALPITDQSFTPDDATTSLFAVLNDAVEFTGQTYRASITGTLAGVSLAVRYAAEPPPYPLRVAIHEVAGGFPIGSVLGATTVTAGESSINEMILFPEPVSQKAGGHYAIVVNYTGDAPPPEESRLLGQWLGATGNPYLTGHKIVSQEGASWRASPDADLYFKTVVDPVPEGGSSLALIAATIAGMVGIGSAGRRRRPSGSPNES